MPNHVLNVITAEPEVLSVLLVDGNKVDFNNIIKMPEIIDQDNIEYALEVAARDCILAPEKKESIIKTFTSDKIKKLKQLLTCYNETGYISWYDWSIANWGTKWNGYDTGIVSANEIRFDTAWSAPHPVIEAMQSTLLHEWLDEDIGNNAGFRRYENGVIVEEAYYDGGVIEAYKLACKLRPELQDELQDMI